MHLRTFRIDDHAAAVELWRAAGLTLKDADSRGEIEKYLAHSPELFLVAEEGGRVVGTVIGGWDGRRGWVYHLAVEPAQQRRGIGQALLAEVERRLAARGALRVNLLVESSNSAVTGFYAALGYVGEPMHFMQKKVVG